MTPISQEFLHAPDLGTFGDCQRACIASLLDLPIAEVPHFLHDGTKDHVEFNQRINRFLSPLGLMHLETHAFDFKDDWKPDCYHMIYGPASRGFRHAVVAFNGEVIHDPHPSRAGLLEDRRNEWTFGFLVRTGVGT